MTKKMKQSEQSIVYVTALLGALGTSLQNFMAFLALFGRVSGLTSLLVNALAGTVSLCSGLVNFCMNIDLLWSFSQRLLGEKQANPGAGWQKIQYYTGIVVFVTTGLLFALTAVAFGPTGSFAVLGIASGIFVGLIMMIQELETWLASFDHVKEDVPFAIIIYEWWNKLTIGKIVGSVISLGNVLALSLLFTSGLVTFLIGLGVSCYPATVIGLTVAFTIGAFTEFYFYNAFLSNFCDQFTKKCHELWNADHALLGVISIVINAVVNAALCYSGVLMLAVIMGSAGLMFPPVGMALVSGLFGGLGSLLLGASFWSENSKHFSNWFSGNLLEKSTETVTKNALDEPSSGLILGKTMDYPIQSYASLWASRAEEKPCQQSEYLTCRVS